MPTKLDNRPTLAQVIQFAIERRLLDVHTSMPAEVKAYDAAKQVADLVPLVRGQKFDEVTGEMVDVDLPVLVNVPVAFAGGGGFRETYPLAPGDVVSVHFAEASIDQWQALGGLHGTDGRRFHIADAVCEPGLHDDTKAWRGASTTKATWGKDGGPQVVATGAGIELGAQDTDPAIEAVVMGTTYRANEDAFFSALVAKLTATAAQLTAAGTALAAAGTAIAVVAAPAGTPMAAGAAALTSAGSTLAAVATDLAAFSASAASYLSTVVKTK